MNDTPRTDAAKFVAVHPLVGKDMPGFAVGSLVAEELERELTEAQHRIRTLIEERDSARIKADHKWRLREEFEALLGTSDVETGVELLKEAQAGKARYEYVSKLPPYLFSMLSLFCISTNTQFDAEVDRRRKEA